MFANWPVLINGAIILLFVNDADHMFISNQESFSFTATRLTFHCIGIAMLQCSVTLAFIPESHSLTVRYRECCKEETMYLEMITLMYFLWFTAWPGQNEVLALWQPGPGRGRSDLDGENLLHNKMLPKSSKASLKHFVEN